MLPNGLLEMGPRDGRRMEHVPIAAKLRRQQHFLTAMPGEQAGKDQTKEEDGPHLGPPWQPASTASAGPERRP